MSDVGEVLCRTGKQGGRRGMSEPRGSLGPWRLGHGSGVGTVSSGVSGRVTESPRLRVRALGETQDCKWVAEEWHDLAPFNRIALLLC